MKDDYKVGSIVGPEISELKFQNTAYIDLINMQAEIQNVRKNKKGYGYTYADLGSILEYVKPILAKHNFCIMQTIGSEMAMRRGEIGQEIETEPLIKITTNLIHSCGLTFSDSMVLPPTPIKGANSAQAVGATITYAKRYALSAMLGIASEDDTDGVVSKNTRRESKPVAVKPTGTESVANSILASCSSSEECKTFLNKYSWNKTQIEEILEAIKEKFQKKRRN